MKRSKKIYWRFLPESNQPITANQFLPLMQHPIQTDCINAITPTITVWDRVNIANGHDPDSRLKRQSYDSVEAERRQLKYTKQVLVIRLNYRTGEYPHGVKGFEDLTLTFHCTPAPTA